MTSEDRYVDAAQDLTAEVRRSPDHAALGSELGKLYTRRFPDLRRELSLTALLNNYAPELTIVGRSGQDLKWGTIDRAPASEVDLSAYLTIEDHSPDALLASQRTLQASFKGYRILKDVQIDLSPLTLLVGPNAAGKSTILHALHRASLLTSRKPLAVFRGRHAITRSRLRGSIQPFELALFGSEGDGFTYRSGTSDSESGEFHAQMNGESVQLTSLLETGLGRALGTGVLLRLNADALSRPSYFQGLSPYLRHDGYYLPSVLSALQSSDPERLERIIAGARSVIPDLRALRTPRAEVAVGGESLIGEALEVDFGQTGWTPADQLSEGTLLVLGMVTLLTRPEPPRLLLLDDLDRGLHPSAQSALIECLKLLLPESSTVVASTHSPFVLDSVAASQVRVVRPGPDGYTRVTPLSEHPKFESWGQEMTAAELWQFVGDTWLE